MQPGPLDDDRFQPSWAIAFAVGAVLLFLSLAGHELLVAVPAELASDSSGEEPTTIITMGSLFAGWCVLHALPWALYLWRRRGFWYSLAVISLMIALFEILCVVVFFYIGPDF